MFVSAHLMCNQNSLIGSGFILLLCILERKSDVGFIINICLQLVTTEPSALFSVLSIKLILLCHSLFAWERIFFFF